MADTKKPDEKKPDESRTRRRKNLAGAVAYDGDTPVYVIADNGDGTYVVGAFASITETSAGLSAREPEPDEPETDEN